MPKYMLRDSHNQMTKFFLNHFSRRKKIPGISLIQGKHKWGPIRARTKSWVIRTSCDKTSCGNVHLLDSHSSRNMAETQGWLLKTDVIGNSSQRGDGTIPSRRTTLSRGQASVPISTAQLPPGLMNLFGNGPAGFWQRFFALTVGN